MKSISPRRRNLVLAVESLEGRALLATVFPIGFVGPLPVDGVYGSYSSDSTSSGGSSSGDDFYVIPDKPMFELGGVSNQAVGGEVGVNVSSTSPDYKLTQVTYTISGGAIWDQTWTIDKADFSYTTGATHTLGTGLGSDSYNWWWDETPGSRTVEVTATYNDPGATTYTQAWTVNVQAPEVNWFRVYGEDTRLGPRDGGWGFYQSSDTSIMAQLANVPVTGTLGVIQFVDSTSSIVGTQTTTTWAFPEPSQVTILDYVNGRQTPFMDSYTIQADPNPYSGHIDFGGGTAVTDNPGVVVPIPTATTTNLYYELHVNDHFSDWLVYQPTNGIRVAIANVNWTFVADAVYNSRDWALYTEPSKWTATGDHPAQDPVTGADISAWRVDGSTERRMLKWDMNAEQAKITYKTVTPTQ